MANGKQRENGGDNLPNSLSDRYYTQHNLTIQISIGLYISKVNEEKSSCTMLCQVAGFLKEAML
jgi:hypothetical protein